MLITPPSGIIVKQQPSNIQPTLSRFAQCIDECVNFGGLVFEWDNSPNKTSIDNLAPSMSLRHFIDVLDSISVLVNQGIGDPTKILLRVLLETFLGLEYMLKADQKRRAMAFIVSDIIKEWKYYKKLSPNTSEGKQYFARKRLPTSSDNLTEDMIKEIDRVIKAKEKLLQDEEYKEAFAEYKKMTKIKRNAKNPNWYSYFQGPPNLEKLAENLGYFEFYELLYRQWSAAVHGTDVYRGKIERVGDASTNIFQIRYVKDVQDAVRAALIFATKLYATFIETRIPEKKPVYAQWRKQVTPAFRPILEETNWIRVT